MRLIRVRSLWTCSTPSAGRFRHGACTGLSQMRAGSAFGRCTQNILHTCTSLKVGPLSGRKLIADGGRTCARRGPRLFHLTLYQQVDVWGWAMVIANWLTGEIATYGTRGERFRRRLARMRHVVWLAVHSMDEQKKAEGGRLLMYTLTYKGVKDWSPRHISGFCRWLRANRVKSYVWVAELQRRGAVHYHVLALLTKGARWKKPNVENGGWARGFTWVTVGVKYPWYIMKYLQKGDEHGNGKHFPRGLRLYGVSQSAVRRMCFSDAVSYRECNLPRWHREGAGDDCVMRGSFRKSGGVAVGRWLAVSPWSSKRPTDVAQVARLMYTSRGTFPNHAAP